MENVTQALYIAFAFLVFIIAFSVALFLVDKVNNTANHLVYRLDKTNYYDSLTLDSLISDNDNADVDNNTSRIVGLETVIPTLYRYYKESFSVKMLDSSGNLLQYFDTTTEGDLNSAIKTLDGSGVSRRTDKQKALIQLYDENKTAPYYMFGVPWLANIDRDTKTRIDLYVHRKKGYINNVEVDYTTRGLPNATKFKEIFTQYAYEGDTITDENDELVTLTGSKQVSTKIVITYQVIN